MRKYDVQAHRDAREFLADFSIYKINQIIDPICHTEQQRWFYLWYATSVTSTGGTNAAECARQAGYSPRGAKVAAARLLADSTNRFLADQAKWWFRHRLEWMQDEENFDEVIEFRTRWAAPYFGTDEVRVQFFKIGMDVL